MGLTVTLGLVGCEETNTDTDYESIDVSAPVSDWQMVWNDEFDGDKIDSGKWFHEINCDGGGNQEQQCYTDSAENSFVADGILNIVAKPADVDSALPYTSARLSTKGLGDWKYGRFEMRAKLPFGQGTWPAFWMLPTDEVYGGWPKSGEIDIVEAVNLKTINDEGVTEAHVFGTLYYGEDWPNQSKSGKEYLLPDGANPADDFHTYAIEWQKGEIRWYVDGYLYETQMASTVRYNSKDQAVGLGHRGWFSEYFDIISGELETHWDASPFDQDFHVLLNLAVGGDWAANVNDGGIDPAAFANSQTYAIDYVRVFECAVDPDTGKGCDTIRSGYKDEEDALVIGKAPIPSPPSTGIPVNLTIFEDAENPLWQMWDCCGGSTPTVETDDEEHGGVSEFIIGATETVMGYTTRAGHGVEDSGPFDASPLIDSGSVKFDIKVVTAPADASSTWMFKIESGDGTTAVELPFTDSNEGVAPTVGEWQSYSFDLSVLADEGLDLSAIDVLMIFPAWGTGDGAVYRVDNVEISQEGAGSLPELVLFEDAANADWAPWDCCGGSTPTEEFDDEDHGLTVEFAIGATETVMGFKPADGSEISFDASALLTDGVVQFDMKVMTAPNDASSTWMFKVESNGTSEAVEIPITDSDEGVAPATGVWQTYTFKISDLFAAGLDPSAIDVIMIFPAWGTGDGAVYRVDNAKIYSPSSSTNPPAAGLTLFADTAATDWNIWDCCGGSTPTVEVDDSEHGNTAEFVIGSTATVMGFKPDDGSGVSYDASALLANGVVQFEMKVIAQPNDASSTWMFKIESGGTTTAVELPLTDSLEGAAPVTDVWQTYTFTLQDLFNAGLDVSEIDVVMIFPAWGTGEGAVYRVDNAKISTP
ncbi:glycosyl hydrolase family 16 [Thalassotalea sp. 42_200_T64]|nr:glycosyl hydrolase family 16 [Thalassotalea sp. 42_200_T64]